MKPPAYASVQDSPGPGTFERRLLVVFKLHDWRVDNLAAFVVPFRADLVAQVRFTRRRVNGKYRRPERVV